MVWKFDKNSPIYMQLVQKIKIMIVSGEYKAGEKIPAVREMAVMAGVNPNTMQRAFVELENQNLVQSQRTSGRYITTNEEIIKRVKIELAQNAVDELLNSMTQLKLSKEEIIDMISSRKERDKNE